MSQAFGQGLAFAVCCNGMFFNVIWTPHRLRRIDGDGGESNYLAFHFVF